jgi:biopolymer transport protein ExbD
MNSGGMIVRLIDICMILLFGFICCSELSQSEIVLPKTVELLPGNPDPEVVVFVGIQNNGLYLFGKDGQHKAYNTQVLESYIQREKNRVERVGHRIRVRLRANHDTPMKFVMAAADVCDKVDVLKTVDVRLGSKVTN